MKRAVEENRSSETGAIVVAHADEPPVKKEPEEPVPSASEFAEIREKLKQSEEKFQKLCDVARRDKEALNARVEHLEKLIDSKEDVSKKASAEDELKKKVSDLIYALGESELRSAQQRGQDSAKVDELTKKLEEERQISAGLREKLAHFAELEKKVKVLEIDLKEANNQAADQRSRDELRVCTLTAQQEKHLKKSAKLKRKLDEARKASLAVMAVLGKENDSSSDSSSTNSSRSSSPSTRSISRCASPSKEDQTARRLMPVVDDVMGESRFEVDLNAVDDQIMSDRNSTLMEENSLNNKTPSGENLDDSGRDEMIGEANESIEEEENDDRTVDDNNETTKVSAESGEVDKNRRPTRLSSRPVKYAASPRPTKINDTELECPSCVYRSRSVRAWFEHLHLNHSTCPRELGLALLCECGDESFSAEHSLKCEISKIRVISKSPTPKCVICEMYPRTASGYAQHLTAHHKTTLDKMGLFLICSCGLEVLSYKSYPEHTKKCNGRNYTLHKVDDE